MFKRFSTNFMVSLFFTDLSLTWLALFLATHLRNTLELGKDLGAEKLSVPWIVYVLVAAVWTFHFTLVPVYEARRVVRAIDETQLVLTATGFATLALAGVLYFTYRDVSRLLFVYFFLLDLAFLLGYRGLLRWWFRLQRDQALPAVRTLIVGAGRVGREVADLIRSNPLLGLQVVGFVDDDPAKQHDQPAGVPVLGTLDDTAQVIVEHHVEEVIVALPRQAHVRLMNLVVDLQRVPVRVKVIPDFFDLAFARASIDNLGGIPVIGLREPAIEGFPRFVKRVFDLVVATGLMIILAPVFAAIAIAIRLDSPGPIFFRQQRVGENGQLFWMLKFRSMMADADAHLDQVLRYDDQGHVVHKSADDPRVTRVGRYLRRTSLDELPQLFNVLRGEMTLVGPRPEQPWLVDRYEPWQRKRFAVPQGITGWWQVNGRSDKPMHLHTEDDLYYIQNYSLLLDLHILWRTIGAVFKGRGAF
jgi:exopolysaccharide biosynthesis polyprenyl glycosylphosphotransferase